MVPTLHDELRAVLALQARNTAPLDEAHALLLSGAALRAYCFAAGDNHAWLVERPGEHWRADSLLVENYGAFESLAAHTGAHARLYRGLGAQDVVALVRYEVDAGRALGAPLLGQGAVVTGLERDGRALRFLGERPGASGVEAFERRVETMDEVATLPEWFGSLLTVRPGNEPVPAERRHALAEDVLRWAGRHHASGRELVHHAEAFYGSGARAFENAAELAADHFAAVHDEQPPCAAFLARFIDELREGRAAVAEVFRSPAAVMDLTGRATLQAALVDGVAAAWGQAAAHLAVTRALVDAGDALATCEALREAAALERHAAEALQRFVDGDAPRPAPTPTTRET